MRHAPARDREAFCSRRFIGSQYLAMGHRFVTSVGEIRDRDKGVAVRVALSATDRKETQVKGKLVEWLDKIGTLP